LDLKPENIIVNDRLSEPKILDFGVGRASQRDGLATFHAGAGTPYYMAPEQERSDDVDHRADLFALGAMAYEVLVGSPPRGRLRAPQELNPGVPHTLGDVVMACLEPSRAHRPQVGEVINACVASDQAGEADLPELEPWDEVGGASEVESAVHLRSWWGWVWDLLFKAKK
jgi:serine/threonine-protein kinase